MSSATHEQFFAHTRSALRTDRGSRYDCSACDLFTWCTIVCSKIHVDALCKCWQVWDGAGGDGLQVLLRYSLLQQRMKLGEFRWRQGSTYPQEDKGVSRFEQLPKNVLACVLIV